MAAIRFTVNSYPRGGTTPNASKSISVQVVNNHPTTGGGGLFQDFAAERVATPGGSLCAANIPWEPEVVSANAGTNNTVPTSDQLTAYAANGYAPNTYGAWEYAKVDGQYTGTTDMIIRWAACKWGIDEDPRFARSPHLRSGAGISQTVAVTSAIRVRSALMALSPVCGISCAPIAAIKAGAFGRPRRIMHG